MKITIKKKIVASASLSPKLKVKYKTVDGIVEISDKLVSKTIAVIDELLDRTWDDWEERGWTGLDFPLVPFPLFEKSRLPENIGIDDCWIGSWLGTKLQNIIIERTTIIETLKEMEGIESIKHNPVINLTAPVFDGDKFELCINRSKLVSLRELIIEKQQEIKKKDKKGEKMQKPTIAQIEITKMPKLKIDGLEKGLDNITKINKKDDKNKFPHKLPAGTKWENFIIKFEDNENVFIQVKQFKHHANYKEMGMVGRGKNPNPSEAWTFMKVLAKCNGELTIRDVQAKDKYKKQKELLAKALQSYFFLDYDPFYPYHSSTEKSGNSYKIKITLILSSDKEEKADIGKDNSDKLGIKKYLDEQAPQVYENQ